MGFFTGLVTLPLAPVRGVAWIAEQLMDEAERQLYDEGNIRRELLTLELEYDEGKIEEEERQTREQELMHRLAVSRQMREDARWSTEEGEDG